MTTPLQSGAKYASNNQHKGSYTYATQQEKQTMEISINKLIAKYKKCITNINRVLTNEPSGSDALTKEKVPTTPISQIKQQQPSQIHKNKQS